jgi:hypothetical protein
MVDPVTGVLLVGGARRLTKQEAAVVREAQVNGQAVQFATRHQWRHFQRRPW